MAAKERVCLSVDADLVDQVRAKFVEDHNIDPAEVKTSPVLDHVFRLYRKGKDLFEEIDLDLGPDHISEHHGRRGCKLLKPLIDKRNFSKARHRYGKNTKDYCAGIAPVAYHILQLYLQGELDCMDDEDGRIKRPQSPRSLLRSAVEDLQHLRELKDSRG